jgi:hypothetical protein
MAAKHARHWGVRPKEMRTLRVAIRQHLREEGRTVTDLAKFWNMREQSARRLMCPPERRITPNHVEAVIAGLKLDEFDANDLRILGARAAGWNINLKLQVA